MDDVLTGSMYFKVHAALHFVKDIPSISIALSQKLLEASDESFGVDRVRLSVAYCGVCAVGRSIPVFSLHNRVMSSMLF